MKFAINVTRLAIWAINCYCLDCLMVYCMNWICRTHRKVTAKLSKRQDGPSGFLLHRGNCQTFCRPEKKVTDKLPIQAKQPFIFPASWKSLPDTMGLSAEDGCCNVTKEVWVTVQAVRSLCQFQSFGSCLQCTSCLLR